MVNGSLWRRSGTYMKLFCSVDLLVHIVLWLEVNGLKRRLHFVSLS